MANIGHGYHLVLSTTRNMVLSYIEFDTNNTSDPDGLDDPAGLVSSVAYAATGRYVVTLKQRWRKLMAICTHADATVGTFGNVESVVDGLSAANVITLKTEYQNTATQTAAATNDKKVSLLLVCVR